MGEKIEGSQKNNNKRPGMEDKSHNCFIDFEISSAEILWEWMRALGDICRDKEIGFFLLFFWGSPHYDQLGNEDKQAWN